MFFTEPKFQKLVTTSTRQMLNQVKQLELATNLQSPRTQKAMESLGLMKQHFRRKYFDIIQWRNKFEIEAELKGDRSIGDVYQDYLNGLINDYRQLKVERKRIKNWLIQKQREEDLLRGEQISQPCLNDYQPEPYKPQTVEDKLTKIDKEREKEKEIVHLTTKQAILMELERRKIEEDLRLRETKSAMIRQSKIAERQQKSSEQNRHILEIQKKHKQQSAVQLERDFQQSQTFQDKFEPKEIFHKEYIEKIKEQIKNKNKENEEKISKRRSLLGHKDDTLEGQRSRKDMEVEMRRQMTAELSAMSRQQKQQQFEIQLKQVNNKNSELKQSCELKLYNNVGSKLDKIVSQNSKREEQCKQMANEAKIQFNKKFDRQRRNLEKQIERLQQLIISQIRHKQEEFKQKLILKQEQVEKLIEQKQVEIIIQKGHKEQQQREHLNLFEQRRRQQNHRDNKLIDKQLHVQQKIQQSKEENNRLLMHSVTSKSKLEQYNLQQAQDIARIHQARTDELIEKLKLISDEETYQLMKDKYLPSIASKAKSLSETQQMFNKK